MLRHCAHIKLFVALAFISVMLWAGSALGQSPATPPVTSQKDVASRSSNSEVASESKPNKTANRVPADESRPEDLKSELETLKSENAAVRELLQKMADQQKALLEQVDRLQRRLDGTASANTQSAGGASGSPQLAEPSLPLTSPTNGPAQPVNSGNASAQQIKPEKFTNYEAGIKWDLRRSLWLTAAVYRLDRTNTRSTDPNDPARIVQTGSQRTNGLELEMNGRITRAWRAMGGYAYQDAFVTNATTAARAGLQVGQVPHHTFSLWNYYQLHPKWAGGNIALLSGRPPVRRRSP